MSPRPPFTDPVFIVGLYKNGTSWLLAALAAHPEFAALRELDVLRSVAGRSGRRLLPERERLANVFGRSAFCALRTEQLERARPLYGLPPDEAVAGLAQLFAADGPKGGPWVSRGKPLSFQNFTPELLANAFAALRRASTPQAAMDGLLAALAPGLPRERRLVLKGADQILCLDALSDWRPEAPRIAIVRDGRDAAVSAFHYRELMRTRRMAWHHGHLSFVKPLAFLRDAGIRSLTSLRRLRGHGPDWRLGRSMGVWADRVRRVRAAAERSELYVMRYEDLLADFDGHFARLLAWLGADATPGTVAAVAKASSFEAMTGRPQGVAAEDVMRKGVAGEWHESFTTRDQALAWRIAGAELAAMGYGRDGVLQPYEPPKRG
ncbi:MAG TPA: sulfotransferase domain-containing protein [Gammaproteobacteria bacterium]|nr:sulfotransferase domain-containing protein [Gammaproteobacteria bacterium]